MQKENLKKMAIKKQFKGLYMPDQAGKLVQYAKEQLNGEYNVYICTKRKHRSLPQNRYYWGVVLHVISRETGIDPEDLHEYFKHKYNLRTEFYNEEKLAVTEAGKLARFEILGGIREVPVSTKMMSTKDFTEYLDKIVRWASEKGMYIPKPNEIPEEQLIEMINNGL